MTVNSTHSGVLFLLRGLWHPGLIQAFITQQTPAKLTAAQAKTLDTVIAAGWDPGEARKLAFTRLQHVCTSNKPDRTQQSTSPYSALPCIMLTSAVLLVTFGFLIEVVLIKHPFCPSRW